MENFIFSSAGGEHKLKKIDIKQPSLAETTKILFFLYLQVFLDSLVVHT